MEREREKTSMERYGNSEIENKICVINCYVAFYVNTPSENVSNAIKMDDNICLNWNSNANKNATNKFSNNFKLRMYVWLFVYGDHVNNFAYFIFNVCIAVTGN